MNVYDSARMEDVLAPLGYVAQASPIDADMVILNTCHIREKAAEKVYSELGRLRHLKDQARRRGETVIIAVGGCVGQAEGAEILRRAPYVDLVFGPQTYHRLPEMVAKLLRAGPASDRGVIDIDFPAAPKFDHLPEMTAKGSSAFLTVQEGCDRFCTFCVVPYTRGAEFSRPVSDIRAEAEGLAASGVREITLLGQNVNAYHGDAGGGLAGLIRVLAGIEGIERLRYTTSHPADMSDDLVAVHGDVPQLMPFLHLPVQSGSDGILKRMNRRHSTDDYRRVVEKLKSARPDIELSSDFIVGFPGESATDFRATVTLAREIGFIQAYSFKYSARPGTPAAMLPDQVPERLQEERLAELQDVLSADQRDFNQSCVGRTLAVLLDRTGRHPGQLAGRSPYMQPVHVTAPAARLGDIVDLEIVEGHANSLGGVFSPAPAGRKKRASA